MGDETSFNLPDHKQESMSELYLGRGILRLSFAQMPHHRRRWTHLIPSPEGDECHHLLQGWPHLLRLCSGRITELAPTRGVSESQALPRENNRSLLSHRTLFWLGQSTAPPPVECPTHACSDILKYGSYRGPLPTGTVLAAGLGLNHTVASRHLLRVVPTE